jgi:putative flippase GtrA
VKATFLSKLASPDRLSRLVRFVLVGLVGTGTYFALTMGLVLAGQPIEIAHIAGYAVSIVVSYLGQKIVTFGIRGQHRRSGFRFLLATAGIAAVQYGLILVLARYGLDARMAVVVSTFYYPVASFLVHTLWTFRMAPVAAEIAGPADTNGAA